MVPWVNICNAAPVSPRAELAPVMDASPSNIKPIWLTLEYATNLLRSVCLIVMAAPYMMFISPRVASNQAKSVI